MILDAGHMEQRLKRNIFRFLVDRPGLFNPMLSHAVKKSTFFRVGNSNFVLGHAQVIDILSRDDEFTIAQMNRPGILTGDFLLAMDNGTQYQAEKNRILNSLDSPLWDCRSLAAAIASRVESLTAGIIDKKAKSGSLDICGELAEKVSTEVLHQFFIGKAVRVPLGELTQHLIHLARLLVSGGSPSSEEKQAASDSAAKLKQLIGQRLDEFSAQRPTEHDLTAQLYRAAVTGNKLDPTDREAIISMIAGLCLGGCVNVSTTLTRAMSQFLSRPGILNKAIIAARDGRTDHVRRYILEVLRFHPMFPVLRRFCVRDASLDVGDGRRIHIRAGESIILVVQAAMQDERVVATPNRIMLDRPLGHYLHFGSGMHKCLGQELAMVQLTIMVSALLRLTPFPYSVRTREQAGIDYKDSWPAARHLNVMLGRPSDWPL